MSEWRRIDDLADIRRGASPRPIGDPKYFGGEVGWVRIADVTRASRFLRETEQYVSPLGESLSVRVNPGDLVMSICGTLGRPIIIDMPACIHDGFVQFSNLRDADSSYLFYALQYAEPAFYGMGQPGTQTNLNTGLVGRYKLFAPRKDEQRRIAKILSTVDEAIEQTEALIAKYQQIKAGLMHDLFTRGVTPDGHLRPARTQAPHLYKESPLGWIPKEWEVKSWGDVTASWAMGPRFSAEEYNENGNLATLRTTDMDADGTINYSTMPRARLALDGMRQHALQPNDFVISRSGTCGTAGVFEGFEIPVLPGAFLIRFRFHSSMSPYFLRFYVNSPIGAPSVARIAEGGVQKNIRGTALCKLLIPVPPRSEQEKVIELILTLDSTRDYEEDQRQKMRLQKHGLMHDLLTGRVRVKVAETASI